MSGEKQIQRSSSGQFRKGQSGNPGGRPKKKTPPPTSGSVYDVIVNKTLTVTKNGIEREVAVEEALQHKTYQQALEGDRAARREILRMILKREQALAGQGLSETSEVEIKCEYKAQNVSDAAMLLGLGRLTADTFIPWKLEHWAVQAALRRRRGGARLTNLEVESIKQSCLSSETLVWPRGTAE